MAALLPWLLFGCLILALLALDLGVFNRRPHAILFREAAAWSAFWIALALAFDGLMYVWRGPDQALEFLTGYVLEKSLSLDNIFMFVLIFSYMGIKAELQHRVLFWGVLGALVMRGLIILVGAELVARFHWVLYLFGLFVVATGIRLLRSPRRGVRPEKNPVLRLARKVFPITETCEGGTFFVRHWGKLMATPLFLVLLLVETSDLLFAFDSIPAVFAVTQNAFVIYTSNVFAILGLRSLYFILAGAMARFRYLDVGLACVLIFVGFKMLLAGFFKLPTGVALLVILAILAVAVAASLQTESNARTPAAREP
jgi:tellurite resistance protein TerC